MKLYPIYSVLTNPPPSLPPILPFHAIPPFLVTLLFLMPSQVSTPVATPVAAPVAAPTVLSSKPVESDVPIPFAASYHSSSASTSASTKASKTAPLTSVEKARFGEVPQALLVAQQQRQMTDTADVTSKASFTSAR